MIINRSNTSEVGTCNINNYCNDITCIGSSTTDKSITFFCNNQSISVRHRIQATEMFRSVDRVVTTNDTIRDDIKVLFWQTDIGFIYGVS